MYWTNSDKGQSKSGLIWSGEILNAKASQQDMALGDGKKSVHLLSDVAAGN